MYVLVYTKCNNELITWLCIWTFKIYYFVSLFWFLLQIYYGWAASNWKILCERFRNLYTGMTNIFTIYFWNIVVNKLFIQELTDLRYPGHEVFYVYDISVIGYKITYFGKYILTWMTLCLFAVLFEWIIWRG